MHEVSLRLPSILYSEVGRTQRFVWRKLDFPLGIAHVTHPLNLKRGKTSIHLASRILRMRKNSISCIVVLGCSILYGTVMRLNADEPMTPTKVIHPFNGKNLDGFYTFQKDSGHKDPNGVYSVADGTIHISGEGRGYLATEQSYRDYHLSIEYKWGKRTDGSGYVRNSGVLLHKINPDNVWPTSIEVQLAQGCEGDLIVIRGKDANWQAGTGDHHQRSSRSPPTRKAAGKPGGQNLKYSGRQFWWSNHQVGFKEKVDTRGKDDVASELGRMDAGRVYLSGRSDYDQS